MFIKCVVRFVGVLGCAFFGSFAYGQVSDDSRALLSSPSLNSLGGTAKFREQSDGTLRYFGKSRAGAIPTGVGGQDPVRAAKAFMKTHGKAFGLMSADHSLHLKNGRVDGGSSFLRYREQFQNIPVYGSGVNVQVNDLGHVQSVFAKTLSDTKMFKKGGISFIPTLGSDEAAIFVEMALEKELAISGIVIKPGMELMIYDPKILNQQGSVVLVWVMEALHESRNDISRTVLIDSHSGEIVLNFSNIHTARDREIYNSFNTSNDPGTLILTESTGSSVVQDVNDAFNFLGDTYDYFLANHGRDSLDDAGYTLSASVNYCEPGYPCPFPNAFWSGVRMYFGEGYAAADDVVGHELTHGLTTFTSDLIYYSQSGAINESLSDIFGEFIDQTNGTGTDNESVKWLMGEDIPEVGAFRSMKNPIAFGDPDRQCSPYYYHGLGDEQGVHINSGVINKLAYLLTDGETFNGYTIEPMGIPIVSELFYYCQVNLLNESSDFDDLYDAITQAAINLNYSVQVKTNIENACKAVELTNIPVDCFVVPENDGCVDAHEVFEGIGIVGGNSLSTASGIASCVGADVNDVWYEYTPNLSGSYSISLFGSSFDTTLAVYDGCGGTMLACNDDESTPDIITSRVELGLSAGQTYRIRVAGYADGTGLIKLLVDYNHVASSGNVIPGTGVDLDTDPGWSTDSGWSYGAASGVAGNPSLGASGINVYGYQRSGLYENSMMAKYLTTGSYNFTGYTNVELKFMRFLGVEGSFDNASIEASLNNGVSWAKIWANSASDYFDTEWTEHVVDLSGYASGQSNVKIRWVMGATNQNGAYFGWNIDDIEFISSDVISGGTGNWLDFAYTGTTTGEEIYPYKFLGDAVDEAEGDGSAVLKIKGDTAQSNTSETGIISKPMRIEAINGVVTLGAAE